MGVPINGVDPQLGTPSYPKSMIEHNYTRNRAIGYFKEGIIC